MKDHDQREFTVFTEALRMPEGEREAFLDETCGDDAELKSRIVQLIEESNQAQTFFDKLEHKTKPLRQKIMEGSERSIDEYRLLEQIGEGGCGIVYRAEQSKPIRRQVALKIIKLGMDTKEVVARFEAERQALAMMDHPNVARVIDAGSTETGRPYFVMELVLGTKITHFCDQQQFSIPQRLELFIQVCRALQHAHQKGVIHRDIKPSNILVAMQDGTACPKVIDFGIAKATEGRLTEDTVCTTAEHFMGTPAYMSPEQAERGAIDIDTRSDIYSLGVLLYELLTGRTPFDSGILVKSGLTAMLQIIREQEPSRPSMRIAALTPSELIATAKNRGTDIAKLVAALRGDLDWIVVKALEKDRSQRYGTVNALARDIERHLASKPVAARPPSRIDWIRKMVRRNTLAVAAGAAVAAALIVGFGTSTWLFLREKDARRQLQGALERQEASRIRAEKEAIKNHQMAGSMRDLFKRYHPAFFTRNTQELKKIADQLSAGNQSVPKDADILKLCILIRGSAGCYDEAGADLDELIELTPGDAEAWHWRAVVLLYQRRYETYAKHCRGALERFKGTKEGIVAERIAKDGLLWREFKPDMEVVDVMLKSVADANPSGWFNHTRGLAEYRKGNFESALKWLQAVPQGKHEYLDAQTLLTMAMAQQRLNKSADASETFRKAEELIATKTQPLKDREANGNWVDRLVIDFLQREAREVVTGKALP